MKSYLFLFAKRTLQFCVIIIVSMIIFISAIYAGAWGAIPNDIEINKLAKYTPSEVYDRNGKLITTFTKYNREPIALENIPPHVIQALVATEDARFYKHKGIDLKSLARVIIKSILLNNDRSGGGSTLSQQIAKNLFNRENHGSLTMPIAKIKEMITARRIEKMYTKEEVLELYLNIVPFSGNTYGIESASQKFFNKSATFLTIAEAATLIGTLKATNFYNPALHPVRSKNRRNVVLYQMHKYGYLDQSFYECTKNEEFHLQFGIRENNVGIAPHFKSKLERMMLQWCKGNGYGENKFDLYSSGLKIYTTIDVEMQELAEQSAREHMTRLQKQFEKEYSWNSPWDHKNTIFIDHLKKLPKYKTLNNRGLSHKQIIDSLSQKRNMVISSFDKEEEVHFSTIDSLQHQIKLLNIGMIAISPQDGAIQVWLGGLNFDTFKYDHLDATRQVGSTFKPIVYSAALERGIDPCEFISGREVIYENLENWSPSNGNQKKYDSLQFSMTGSLTNSLNAVSVKILEKTGIDRVARLSKKLNITSKIPKVPSLALGTAELSISELAGAYAAYANDGRPVIPYFLKHIKDEKGQILKRSEPREKKKRALKPDTREAMIYMLQSVVNRGTGSRLRYKYGLKNDIGGKTGTTQDNKDAWFVGLMPKLVTVTWVGHDDHRIGFRTTRTGQGANAALPVTALLLQKMNTDTIFNSITQARFPKINERLLEKLDCPLSITEEKEDYSFWSYLFKRKQDSVITEKRNYLYSM